jgi:hypothetical protein
MQWVLHSGLQQGPINEEDLDAETFGCKDWLVNENDMISSSLLPTVLQLLQSLTTLEVLPTALQLTTSDIGKDVVIVIIIVALLFTMGAITNGTRIRMGGSHH